MSDEPQGGLPPTNPRFGPDNDPVFMPICAVCRERIEPGEMYCEDHEPDD